MAEGPEAPGRSLLHEPLRCKNKTKKNRSQEGCQCEQSLRMSVLCRLSCDIVALAFLNDTVA